MHGLRTEALVPHYLALRDSQGLDLLCLQEDRYLTGSGPTGEPRPSVRIIQALGSRYQLVRDDGCVGLSLIYDAGTLHCRAREVIPLPRLERLSWFEKLYIVGGKSKQKHVLLAEMEAADGGGPFAVVCFHLDTAGGNAHRLTQVRSIAEALGAPGRGRRIVASGDTNAFAWRHQPQALRTLLAPLAPFGAVHEETQATVDAPPTHFFARQNEPKLLHRAGVLLGKLGIDLPRRYDVVCTNLPVRRRGQVATVDSDHDLVWAELGPSTPTESARSVDEGGLGD
jgi:endonuclease/exonuclease/phosphatase family metal-dependent hydrolase